MDLSEFDYQIKEKELLEEQLFLQNYSKYKNEKINKESEEIEHGQEISYER